MSQTCPIYLSFHCCLRYSCFLALSEELEHLLYFVFLSYFHPPPNSNSICQKLLAFLYQPGIGTNNNKYKCNIDQRTLLHGRRADAASKLTRWQHFCMKWCHICHLENMTSHWKSGSVNWCVLTWWTFAPNFIPIRCEMIEPSAFLKRSPQQEEQDEFLI